MRLEAVDASLKAYFDGFGDRLDDLRTQFKTDGYIEIPQFGPADVKEAILTDVDNLLAHHAQRRMLHIASTGNTPRYYEAIGRNAIVENSTVIPAAYRSAELQGFLTKLTGESEIIPVPHPPEEIVITRMTQAGDSHGWHWDDYPYSLIWIVQALAVEDGGSLEYVPDTQWDKKNSRIEEYLRRGPIERRHPATGSMYLLKGDTAMHRVTPLNRDGVCRTILCFSYGTLADIGRQVSHETMEEMYPEDHVNL